MLRFLLTLLFLIPVPVWAQNPREKKVRDDKVKVEADGFWIYNDLAKAFTEAKKTGKPLIVVLRCIPCEECVKLDDNLVDQDPELRPLLEQFVRVRVVSTNGLDLSLFQFDTDQSFAVFFLSPDKTIYGRFGTRSHRKNWVGDVSVTGLGKAMQAALKMHQNRPTYQTSLAAKKGPAPQFPVPEQFPSLGKYSAQLNYQGNVVQSCIHCHQIGDATRDLLRKKREAFPEEVIFPYPHPKSQGLIFDPKECATVLKVEEGSPAAKAGLQTGDRIERLANQPLLSIADVQWVLHHLASDGAEIPAQVTRNGKSINLTLTLPKGWRQSDDISWRSSSWGYRRMTTGGLLLESLEERPRGVPVDGMALHVKHVGEYGPHAAAKNAGVKPGDVLIAYDGRKDLTRESDLFAYSLRTRRAGEKVPITVVRNGKPIELTLPIQE